MIGTEYAFKCNIYAGQSTHRPVNIGMQDFCPHVAVPHTTPPQALQLQLISSTAAFQFAETIDPPFLKDAMNIHGTILGE
jgi:hypothetical protein